MKIVVAVKQVASLDDEFELEPGSSAVDPADIELDLNEWDSFSLEAALLLREAEDEGEVVTVTIGDEDAEEVLRTALAKGSDRATRLWDESLRDADPIAIARVLAAAIAKEEPDLVLCGVQSSDMADGAVGVAAAGFLDLPHVAVVKGISREGQDLLVERELEGGTVESIRIPLPALLTIQTGLNEPRYANLRAIKQAEKLPVDALSLEDLDLASADVDAASGSRRRRLFRPEAGKGAEMISGSEAEIARKVVDLVKEGAS